MSDLAESFCYPVCLACGVAGVCARVSEIKPVKAVRGPRGWAPNRLKVEVFECGHEGIPWPVVKQLGRVLGEVMCETCGEWVGYRDGGKKVRGKRVKKGEVDGQGVIPF